MKLHWQLLMSIGLVYTTAQKLPPCSILDVFEMNSLYKKGDIVLGGIFEISVKIISPDLSFRVKPEQWKCDGFDVAIFQRAQAMVFAIEEINRNETLLPNITLGYRLYDNCQKIPTALRAATALFAGLDDVKEEFDCYGSPPVLAIIGDPASTHSIAISRIVSLFRIPMVSYYATCSCLSNKQEFPSFFRTIPSDTFQIKAMIRILKHYKWTWVGALAGDDDYGQNAVKLFIEEVKTFGCISFTETIPKVITQSRLLQIVDRIKRSTAKVIVVLSSRVDFTPVAIEVVRQNITGRQWIASEAWATSVALATKENFACLGGTIGVAIRRGEIPGFQNFLLQVHPDVNPNTRLLVQFWETMFGCSFQGGTHGQNVSVDHLICTGYENISSTKTGYSDVSQLRGSYNIYKAVYALAHALHNLMSCESGKGPFENHTCPNITSVQPWQVPESVCSKSCRPGSRKATRKREPVCCFDCVPCADGEISSGINSIECVKCPADFWSNPSRTQCLPKEIEFLSYGDPMGITLTTVSLFGVCLSICVLVVFIIYRNTPVVKANNSELSFLLLVSLTFCFLCALCFIGQPTDLTCILRHIVFGISFVLCVSCILVKTIVVIVAFKATLPGNNMMKWFGVSQQRGTIFLFTLIQSIICIIWLSTAPPSPVKNTKYQNEKIIFECDNGSIVGFSSVLGYIGLLACTCFAIAFLSRNLPDTFNEAKFITFSMLLFCAVWISFIPAYISSPGKYTVAVEVFAILASSFGLLLAIFSPKCFIILLKPELNNKKSILGKVNPK
ncbi:extracellular calcium-sensing receptor-like isoform X2 [Erpetoichthys calabaricus]|uniref:extracellular calcium-sensing receptor-like isoform X2 n=1 Tax=Erpetoichthys calabaricus TaxID=27687 RepID=UPI002234156B|nr:extracellular calcium-sensing receptor-like isoform X2 [Erpetoichthys calabaricus]